MELQISENTLLAVLIKRLEMLNPSLLKQVMNPVVIGAEIVDRNALKEYIQSKYPNMSIKSIGISVDKQRVEFKIYGTYFCEPEDRNYILILSAWSPVKTDKYSYENVIKEEYAQSCSLPVKECPGIRYSEI